MSDKYKLTDSLRGNAGGETVLDDEGVCGMKDAITWLLNATVICISVTFIASLMLAGILPDLLWLMNGGA